MIRVLGVCALVVGVAWLIRADIKRERAWRAWASEHCTVTGRIAAQTVTGLGIGSNGGTAMVTSTIPSQTTYQCDDGVTYTR